MSNKRPKGQKTKAGQSAGGAKASFGKKKQDNNSQPVDMEQRIFVAQDVPMPMQSAEASLLSTFIVQDTVTLGIDVPSSELIFQDVAMQDPEALTSGLYSMPGSSGDIDMSQSFTPGPLYAIWGDEKKHRCMVCVAAGLKGTNCKGKNNRKCCEFVAKA
ncbi:hypothetical protein CVT25_012053 [Psilocybe cyanescens]|uniref:Uncharacterized protein n=1 Tax=Psilocybe cyanescens TaxID=93625 RepID=A0A409X7U1_PSICY|nr:hypothetical protein CVT25_012053 [Psilocybe cyanescens]